MQFWTDANFGQMLFWTDADSYKIRLVTHLELHLRVALDIDYKRYNHIQNRPKITNLSGGKTCNIL